MKSIGRLPALLAILALSLVFQNCSDPRRAPAQSDSSISSAIPISNVPVTKSAAPADPISGVLDLPCGTYSGIFLLNDGAILEGSGPCTIIGGVAAADSNRHEHLKIENLTIDGSYAGQYIGIDFRNVSRSTVRDVSILHVQTGVFLYNMAMYNLFESVFININWAGGSDGYEIIGGPDSGANQTTILGGQVGGGTGSGQVGILFKNSDYLTITGLAIEGIPTCVQQVSAPSLYSTGLRCSPN